VLRKTDDVKRELKWKSDAAAAAAAATSSPSNSDVSEHQQSVVRSCFSRLRRGSDFKKTTTTSARLSRATAAAARPAALEEEQEDGPVRCVGNANKMVAMTTVSGGRDLGDDVTSLKEGALHESQDAETEDRRRRVLAMLRTPDGQRMDPTLTGTRIWTRTLTRDSGRASCMADGQQMVRQMFAARDELKRELAGLAQRLKRIDDRIGAMLQSGSSA